jgi:hypothetical protein
MHNGFIWLDKEYTIYVEEINKLTGLSMDGKMNCKASKDQGSITERNESSIFMISMVIDEEVVEHSLSSSTMNRSIVSAI